MIGRPITVKPPGSGGAQSDLVQPGFEADRRPGRAPGPWGSGRSPRGAGSESRSRSEATDVEAAIFAADGRTLIASDDSGAVSLVDIATGRPIRPPLSVGNVAADSLDSQPGWTAGGRGFVRRGRSSCGTSKTGAPYGSPLTADTSPVSDVAFSPDGRTLVSSHLRSAVVWNMDGEQVIGEPLGGPTDLATDVAFSPDGKGLARRGGSTAARSSTTRRSADRLLRIDGDSVVTAVAFHPDGNLIAVGTIDGKVRFFDPTSGAAVGSPLDEGDAAVWQVAFSPNGRLLAVAVDPNGAGHRVLQPAAAGRGAALGRGLPAPRGSGDRAGRRIGARRGVQRETARCWRQAAAGGSTCGTWPPRPATASR